VTRALPAAPQAQARDLFESSADSRLLGFALESLGGAAQPPAALFPPDLEQARGAHTALSCAGEQPAAGGSNREPRLSLLFCPLMCVRPPHTHTTPPPPQAFEAHAGGLAGVEDRLELLQAELETLRLERATLDAPLAAFETPEARPPAAPPRRAAAARRSSPAAAAACCGRADAASLPPWPRGSRRASGGERRRRRRQRPA